MKRIAERRMAAWKHVIAMRTLARQPKPLRVLFGLLWLTILFMWGKTAPCLAADSDFVIENGELTAYTGSASKVTIPNTVTKIGPNAFCKRDEGNNIVDNTTLQTVVIPDSVTQIGYSAFEKCVNLKSVTIPDSVTSIQMQVFQNCKSLKSITLPSKITSISDYTFYQCDSLETVTIPNTVTRISQHAFSYCKSLHHVVLPSELTNLDMYAFSESGLTAIEIPDGVTTLGQGAFTECKSLTRVKFPANLTTVKHSVFRHCSALTEIDLPDTVTSLGNSAFYECSALTRVHLPANLETIENSTFFGDDGLLYVEIPEGVKQIGNKAFWSCEGLVSVSLPSTLLEIGEEAFANCRALQTMIVPEKTTTIGTRAFAGCTGMYALQLPKTLTSIGEQVLGNLSNASVVTNVQKIYYGGTKTNWNNIENASKSDIDPLLVIGGSIPADEIFTPQLPSGFVIKPNDNDNYNRNGILVKNGVLLSYTGTATTLTVPKIVTYIADEAFKGNTTLEKVVIQGNVYGIGAGAFRECTALKEVTLPKSLRVMGEYAFYQCSALEKIKIPEGVNVIRYRCFSGCTSLAEVTFPSSLYLIGEDAFYQSAIKDADLSGAHLVMMDKGAFSSSKQLERVSLPECFRTLGSSSFRYCSSLTQALVPKKTKTIGASAFDNCQKLSEFTCPDDITIIPKYCFSVCDLQTLVLPEGVTKIGSSAFTNNDLKEVRLPSTLTEIGDSAFRYSYDMKALLLPENLGIIEKDAFYGCSHLENLYLPAGTKVDKDAFQSVYTIKNIYFGGNEEKWNSLGGTGVGGDTIFADSEDRNVVLSSNPAELTQMLSVYHITYDFNGGEAGWWEYTYTYTFSSEKFKIQNPAKRTGYYFVGWKEEGSDAAPQKEFYIETGSTGDRHYIAQWTEEYTITYDLAEGTERNNPTTYTALDKSFTLNKPYRYEYSFLGWTGSNGDVPQLEVTVDTSKKQNLTFVANWIKYYTISYNLDGGKAEGNPVQYAAEFDDITLVNPTKENTEFLGWLGTDAGPDPVKDLVIPHGSSGNRSYIAVWKGGKYDKDVYTITYDLDGGTMEGNPDSYTSKDPAITIIRPRKENYEFCGWWATNPFVKGTYMDPIIPTGCRGDVKFFADFIECDHEDMRDEPKVEPTCTEDGHEAWQHCGCYKVSTTYTVIPALGHQYDEGVVTTKPTEAEPGVKTFTCTRCGDTYTEQIPALGGNGGQNGTTDGEFDATISANSVSGNDLLAHTTSKGPGFLGDDLLPLKKGKTFIVKNARYKVTKTGRKPEAALLSLVKDKKSASVPDKVTYKGITYQVTSIASKAFMKNKKLRKVTIGKNVKKIGKKAFAKCRIKKLTIKTKKLTPKKVGAKAFSGIVKRAKVKVPKGKKTLYTAILRKKGMPRSAKVK